MIFSGRTVNPSQHIQRRSANMHARLIGRYYEAGEHVIEVLVRPEKGKVSRIVSFHRIWDDVRIDCYDRKSFATCPANRFRRHCSHVESAINLLLEMKGKEK